MGELKAASAANPFPSSAFAAPPVCPLLCLSLCSHSVTKRLLCLQEQWHYPQTSVVKPPPIASVILRWHSNRTTQISSPELGLHVPARHSPSTQFQELREDDRPPVELWLGWILSHSLLPVVLLLFSFSFEGR
ncbi:hypothetical protein CRG98_001454 [Punica granatum]|uniref:Uncharacterized protein n=1 Tax=Punica granatum TaxID=22663 RepID=A0A2I0LD41_PUNGR|nr:hypothetical protein CRG98_001454 [Punica granatum]